ncbi:MAG: NAD(P)(+) transhydrogenase (Re/Si-specific) subunit alpha, partial [Asticcacaulis sp.]
AQVASMTAGSVLVDLAAPQGGNVEGTVADTVADVNGVKIYGPTNIVTAIGNDASALYAKNLQAFVGLLINKEGQFAPDFEDEILKAALVTQNGAVVHPALQS